MSTKNLERKIPQKLLLAFELQREGDIEKAKVIYEEILVLEPNNHNALQLLGVIEIGNKQYTKALDLFIKSLEINPLNHVVYLNKGNALNELKRFDEALDSYDKAIEIKPDYSRAFYNRGITLAKLHLHFDALVSFDNAINLKLNNADVYLNRGIALKDLHRLVEALESFDKAIELKQDNCEAYCHRGNVLKTLGRLDESHESYNKAIEFNHDYADAYCNRGTLLQELNRFEEALSNLNKAIELKPDFSQAYYNRANVFRELMRFNEALENYDMAIQFEPDHSLSHFNKSLALLLNGNFEKGFIEYEWRWGHDAFKELAVKRSFIQPLWNGSQSLLNKKILLFAEQGLGDSIQFCRYAKLVSDLGANVILEVQKPLTSLINGLEGVDLLIERGQMLPDFDFQCPLMSLPKVFRTTLHSIPSSTPYLKYDKQILENWKKRLGSKSNPRIGLVWSGNQEHDNDRARSISLKELLQHLPISYEYVCLQKEVRQTDKEALSNSKIKHYEELLTDFSDTAALCELMDIVITVDTSVAHLAGALGKTTWLLLPYIPDWRWLLERNDSPWYDTLRLYRQGEDRQYAPVLSKLAKDLVALLNNRDEKTAR